jgi:hypothetical protein
MQFFPMITTAKHPLPVYCEAYGKSSYETDGSRDFKVDFGNIIQKQQYQVIDAKSPNANQEELGGRVFKYVYCGVLNSDIINDLPKQHERKTV